MFIVLNSEQADVVRGPTEKGSELVPIILADGNTYVLPVEVLADEAHAVHHEYLAALPQQESVEFPVPADLEEVENEVDNTAE